MLTLARDEIRERIHKRVVSLRKGYRQNIGLIGPLGIGKTFVLTDVLRDCAGAPDQIGIYVHVSQTTFEDFVDQWVGALLTGVIAGNKSIASNTDLNTLFTACQHIIPRTLDRIYRLKKTVRREQNASSVKELFALTATLSQETGKKILLLIDEFHHLEHLPTADPFALLGKEIMVEKDTLYFVTSSKPERAKEIFRDKLSLLFGNFEVMELEPLSFAEIRHYLAQRLPGYSFSGAQLRMLMSMTDGEPLPLELMADRFDSLLSPSDGSSIPDKIFLTAFHRELYDIRGRIIWIYQNRVEICERFAKNGAPYLGALQSIAEGKRKLSAIASAINMNQNDAKKVLQRLVSENIVWKQGAFFMIKDPLFRFWLVNIWQKRNKAYLPNEKNLGKDVFESLERVLEKEQVSLRRSLPSFFEDLFRSFRNDVVEFEDRVMRCPLFQEVALVEKNDAMFSLIARNQRIKWLCQIATEPVNEETLAEWLDRLRRSRKKYQRKIFIALRGIDQNAKLRAQEAKLQIWGLREVNALLDLYDLPKCILDRAVLRGGEDPGEGGKLIEDSVTQTL